MSIKTSGFYIYKGFILHSHTHTQNETQVFCELKIALKLSKPDFVIIAANPTVFKHMVLPPVLGPVIIKTRVFWAT